MLSSPNVGVDPEPIFLRVYCTLKRNAGFREELQITSLIPSLQVCSRKPVIRNGHGSTVPNNYGLHYLEVVGCSKLSTIQPTSGTFRLCRFINQACGCFFILGVDFSAISGPPGGDVTPFTATTYDEKYFSFFRKKIKNLLTICRYIL